MTTNFVDPKIAAKPDLESKERESPKILKGNEKNVSGLNETRQATESFILTSSGSKSSHVQIESNDIDVNSKLSEESEVKEPSKNLEENTETDFASNENKENSKIVELEIKSSNVNHQINELSHQKEDFSKVASESEDSSSSSDSDSDSSSSSDESESEEEKEEISKIPLQLSTPVEEKKSETTAEKSTENVQTEEKFSSNFDSKNNDSSSDSSSSSSSDDESDDEVEDEKQSEPVLHQPRLEIVQHPEIKSELDVVKSNNVNNVKPLEKIDVENESSSGDESDEEETVAKPRVVLRIKLDPKQLKVFREQQLAMQSSPSEVAKIPEIIRTATLKSEVIIKSQILVKSPKLVISSANVKSPEIIKSSAIVKSPKLEPWLIPLSLDDIFFPPPMLSPIREPDFDCNALLKVLTILTFTLSF